MPTALISVFHKEGIVDFARDLVGMGWSIIASGGTAKTLSGAGVFVRDVADLVGGGSILGHRVVTLSREVHAGLLARNIDVDIEELEKLGLPRIDLVCVDLYPLKQEIEKPDCTMESVIEQTDIGGPTMLRSAAKGNRIVVCDPDDRSTVIQWLRNLRPDEESVINTLAAKAEAIVADYCLTSARYRSYGYWNGVIGGQFAPLKYGENAWQQPAALHSAQSFASVQDPLAIEKFELILGNNPSFNNLCDLDRALQTMTHIAAVYGANNDWLYPSIAVGVKHGNACGAAVGHNKLMVIKQMASGDPMALFGGVVMTNFALDEKEVRALQEIMEDAGQKPLLDAVVAPAFSLGAVSLLERKGGQCRIFSNDALYNLDLKSLDLSVRFRQVRGGFLRQPAYSFVLNFDNLEINGCPTPQQSAEMLLAWAIGSTSNSNTITLVKDRRLISNAVGQRSRVAAVRLAIDLAMQAGHDTCGSVAYSDSFFPFVDALSCLIDEGIVAILASSGSVNDEAVKQYCRDKGVILCLVPDKEGRGFYGH